MALVLSLTVCGNKGGNMAKKKVSINKKGLLKSVVKRNKALAEAAAPVARKKPAKKKK